MDAFRSGHRHHLVEAQDEEGEAALTPAARRLHGRLLDLVGDHTDFPALDLEDEDPRVQAVFDGDSRAILAERDLERAESEVVARTAEIGHLRDEIDRRSEQAGALADDAMALRAELEAAQERLAALGSWFPLRAARRLGLAPRGQSSGSQSR
ncbi:MAG: hypothetical protein AAGK32_11345 [Actinomycetota bacterium]